MDTLRMILMGLVQGLTEFLPVSSSGHVSLAKELLGITLGVREVVVLHVGTLVGMVHFFRAELFAFARTLLPIPAAATDGERTARQRDRKLLFCIAIGTFVTVVIALTVRPLVDAAMQSLTAVGVGLIGTGLVLRFVFGGSGGRDVESESRRDLHGISPIHAATIGVAQSLALFPGISRAGITIAAGTLLGYRQSEAARFSFLLSFPTIAGAAILVSFEDGADVAAAAGAVGMGPLLIGAAAAAISGWLALHTLFALFRRTTLAGFSYYCFGVGLLAVAFDRLG